MKPLLFVRVHDSSRRQMTEAFFNHLAGGRARTISSRTMAAERRQPEVVQDVAEVGIDIGRLRPKLLTPEMIASAAPVITVGCRVEGVCPDAFVPTEDWRLEDPKGQPIGKIREIRDEICRRVEGLLVKLKGAQTE